MKLEPFPKRATSRYGEGVAFHLADALFTLAMPCVADRGDVSLGRHSKAVRGNIDPTYNLV
jgi:hypothetical protein